MLLIMLWLLGGDFSNIGIPKFLNDLITSQWSQCLSGEISTLEHIGEGCMKKTIRVYPKKMSVDCRRTNEYDCDFYKWTKSQVDKLKSRDFSHLDLVNLIEEIKSLGKSDLRSLKSHLIILLKHLLKKKYQPEGKGNSDSWESSISNSKTNIELIIEDSPSLKNELIKVFEKSYQTAREGAIEETKLKKDKIPVKCPWTLQELFPHLRFKKDLN